ncbi:MAG: asparagine--tRNA ligase [SAR324 cluster bacterium]|nr:asparagine--tRNA ligase [SAR324 cluster bacterium]
MPKRLKINTLLKGDLCGQEVCARGWVRTKRDSKSVSFINLNDGSNQMGIQIIVDTDIENYEAILHLNTGAAIEAVGKLVDSPGKGQKFEIHADQIHIYGNAPGESYPLQKKGHSLEYLREIAYLRPRTNTLGCVFRIRNGLAHAIHQFFQDRGFIYVHAPVITASDAEGSGEMFQVTTLDLKNPPATEKGALDYSQDFFGKPVFLTVSGQLEAEIFALALSDVYTFGPTFRAENSNTSRHLAEFWMIEPEISFCDLDDMTVMTEEFLKYLLHYCLEHYREDLEFLQKFYNKKLIATLEGIVQSTFKKITYSEAVDVLQKSGKSFEFPVQWGADLQSEHERFLTEQHFKCPVVVVDYPKDIKAFYMRQNDDGRTVAAMDVLFPKLGEIIGGSQREERYDSLLERIHAMEMNEKEYWWYLNLRRFGTVPHSGFGLGFERLVQFATGMDNIRDVIPFPRVPKHAEF